MVEEGKLPPLIKNKEAIFSTPEELDNHSPGNFLLTGLIDKTGGFLFVNKCSKSRVFIDNQGR